MICLGVLIVKGGQSTPDNPASARSEVPRLKSSHNKSFNSILYGYFKQFDLYGEMFESTQIGGTQYIEYVATAHAVIPTVQNAVLIYTGGQTDPHAVD